ncbi:MAG: flagellar hook-length control protein FliK [Paracoccaceae bacterium]
MTQIQNYSAIPIIAPQAVTAGRLEGEVTDALDQFGVLARLDNPADQGPLRGDAADPATAGTECQSMMQFAAFIIPDPMPGAGMAFAAAASGPVIERPIDEGPGQVRGGQISAQAISTLSGTDLGSKTEGEAFWPNRGHSPPAKEQSIFLTVPETPTAAPTRFLLSTSGTLDTGQVAAGLPPDQATVNPSAAIADQSSTAAIPDRFTAAVPTVADRERYQFRPALPQIVQDLGPDGVGEQSAASPADSIPGLAGGPELVADSAEMIISPSGPASRRIAEHHQPPNRDDAHLLRLEWQAVGANSGPLPLALAPDMPAVPAATPAAVPDLPNQLPPSDQATAPTFTTFASQPLSMSARPDPVTTTPSEEAFQSRSDRRNIGPDEAGVQGFVVPQGPVPTLATETVLAANPKISFVTSTFDPPLGASQLAGTALQTDPVSTSLTGAGQPTATPGPAATTVSTAGAARKMTAVHHRPETRGDENLLRSAWQADGPEASFPAKVLPPSMSAEIGSNDVVSKDLGDSAGTVLPAAIGTATSLFQDSFLKTVPSGLADPEIVEAQPMSALMLTDRLPQVHRTDSATISSTPPPPPAATQIVQAVGQSDSEVTQLRLAPEELGEVRIDLRSDGDRLIMTVSAERRDTLDLLRRNADELAAEMRTAGHQRLDLSFGRWAGSDGGSGGRAAPPPPVPAPSQSLPTPILTDLSPNRTSGSATGLYLRI